MKKILLTVFITLSFATQIFAHQLWLERSGETLKAYFGHFPNFKEKESGKRLKAIKGLKLNPQSTYVSTKRKSDHIEITVNTQKDIALIEKMSPRKGKFVDFTVQTIFLAREGRKENKDLLYLDIVPESPNSNTFFLKLNKEVLPKMSLSVVAPNGWSKKFKSDKFGKVTIETPWKGDYVASLKYTDKTPGKADGKDFEQTNYVMSLHFNVNE
jgi:hypothetical protein